MSSELAVRGFIIKRESDIVDVFSPQPFAERFAVFGSALYAIAIVVEAVRSRAWLAALVFVVIAGTALWVAGGRARYRLGRSELVVSTSFISRGETVRLPTIDVVDFVARAGVVRVLTRGGGTLDLPRGTMRSDDEARTLAEFLRAELGGLREREAGYRSFCSNLARRSEAEVRGSQGDRW